MGFFPETLGKRPLQRLRRTTLLLGLLAFPAIVTAALILPDWWPRRLASVAPVPAFDPGIAPPGFAPPRADDPLPVGRVEELARLCGFTRLRDLDVPEEDLDEVAEATAVRPGAKANPRPASVDEIAGLLRSVW